jgi:hypothetical protein
MSSKKKEKTQILFPQSIFEKQNNDEEGNICTFAKTNTKTKKH